MTIVQTTCPLCGETHIVEIEDDDAYEKWRDGESLIQEAFPKMAPSDRELLKTGICLRCWTSMFGEGEGDA